MKALSKLTATLIALTLLVGLILVGYPIVDLSASDWPAEIERRGWRVLYSNQSGNHFIAVCDAGDNKMAIVDSEWNRFPSSAINIMDSEHHGITVAEMEPIMCPGIFGLEHLAGFILPIKVPPDGRIRVVRQAAFVATTGEIKSGGEILLDVEVDWNAPGEPTGQR